MLDKTGRIDYLDLHSLRSEVMESYDYMGLCMLCDLKEIDRVINITMKRILSDAMASLSSRELGEALALKGGVSALRHNSFRCGR